MDYAVVIPAYNEARLLPATLEAIARAMACVARPGQVVVADNASTDETAAIARAHGARVVHEPHRQIARARNAGARATAARRLIFVDADTVVPPEALAQALALLDSGRVVGGGALVQPDEASFVATLIFDVVWARVARRLRLASGSFLFCTREAYDGAGGFDERYYGGEELIFNRGLRRWGRRRGQYMRLIDAAVVTSARKARWYSSAQLLAETLRFAVMPWKMYSREGCWIWYERPDGQ